MSLPIKQCLNIECRREISTYKSAKRKFCSDQCRNRHGFLNRKRKNKEMDRFIREIKQLGKFLRTLIDANIHRIYIKDFIQSKFKNYSLPKLDYMKIEGKMKYGCKLGSVFLEGKQSEIQLWYYFFKIE